VEGTDGGVPSPSHKKNKKIFITKKIKNFILKNKNRGGDIKISFKKYKK
jgi:hypothetical protein